MAITDFSRPGKPTHNAFIELLNVKSRAELFERAFVHGLDDAHQPCKLLRERLRDKFASGAKTGFYFYRVSASTLSTHTA